jgi:superfamily I DNA and RNA helicase
MNLTLIKRSNSSDYPDEAIAIFENIQNSVIETTLRHEEVISVHSDNPIMPNKDAYQWFHENHLLSYKSGVHDTGIRQFKLNKDYYWKLEA